MPTEGSQVIDGATGAIVTKPETNHDRENEIETQDESEQ